MQYIRAAGYLRNDDIFSSTVNLHYKEVKKKKSEQNDFFCRETPFQQEPVLFSTPKNQKKKSSIESKRFGNPILLISRLPYNEGSL